MTDPAPSGVLLPPPADPLCLDFANTRYWRGSAEPIETLREPGDLLTWIGGAGLPGGEALRARWEADPAAGAAEWRAALDVRETIYRVLAEGVATADLAALNAALAEAPERRRLEATAQGFGWRAEPWRPTLPYLLAPVLWSAADLLAGPRRGRVRICANPKCRWLFLDDSKAGNRRWCSMASCGNRAKAHRHYAKRKAQG